MKRTGTVANLVEPSSKRRRKEERKIIDLTEEKRLLIDFEKEGNRLRHPESLVPKIIPIATILNQFIRPKTCTYVDPASQSGLLVTKSENISIVALITCVKHNIPLESILRSWWQTVDEAKGLVKTLMLTPEQNHYPAAEVIAFVWQHLKKSSKTCYSTYAANFLYDLYLYGQCNCSCGAVAVRELMLQVNPFIECWYIFEPSHIFLGALNEVDLGLGNPAPEQVMEIETTEENDIAVVPYEREGKEDKDHYSLRGQPRLMESFHAYEWFRYLSAQVTWNPETKQAAITIPEEDFQLTPEMIQLLARIAVAAQATSDAWIQPHSSQFFAGFFLRVAQLTYMKVNQIDGFNYLALRFKQECKEERKKCVTAYKEQNEYGQVYGIYFFHTCIKIVNQLRSME